METWYFAGYHLTRHGLSLLNPEMMKSSAVTNLSFKCTSFGPNSSSLLADLVLRTPNLRTLDLETTELGDKGAKQFIEFITGHTVSLRHLYLNANGIGQNACSALSQCLADPHYALESLFLSTNPIGDAGMLLLAPGLAKNKTLKRVTFATAGLTSKGVACIANALSEGDHPIQSLALGASMTPKAHGQRFKFLEDDYIEALKPFILLPHLRWLDLGRTVFSADGFQDIRSTVANSELIYFNMHRVQITN